MHKQKTVPDGQNPGRDMILLKNASLANLHANDFILPSVGT